MAYSTDKPGSNQQVPLPPALSTLPTAAKVKVADKYAQRWLARVFTLPKPILDECIRRLQAGEPAIAVARWHGRQRTDDRRLLPVPLWVYAQDAEAAVVVVVGNALDQAGDFLGRGPAFRGRGIHLDGIHFPMDGSGFRDRSGNRFYGDLGCPEGFRSVPAFQKRGQPFGPDWRASKGAAAS